MPVSEKVPSIDISVLIIAYQRPQNVHRLLEWADKSGAKNVYLAVDFPKNATSDSLANYKAIKNSVAAYKRNSTLIIKEHYREKNVGCSASVLSAIDWAFEKEQSLIILEDDCLPVPEFMDYVNDSFRQMKNESKALLACGTQFAPLEISGTASSLSHYMLTWGWATTSEKWNQIKRQFSDESRFNSKKYSLFRAEKQYWASGARRAYEGYVDVWDTVLANILYKNGWFAILPSQNLVENTGADAVDTQTKHSYLTLRPTYSYHSHSVETIRHNKDLDLWLKRKFFQIRIRHLLTTRITFLKDRTITNRKFEKDLISRWTDAAIKSDINY